MNKVNAVIQCRSLKKNYSLVSETIPVLKGLDFEIEKGEYVAITGASGSGKSTLMNVLGCLDMLSEGSYILNGRNIAGMSDNQLSQIRNQEIGFIFQTFNLLMKKDVVENVKLSLAYTNQKIPQSRVEAIISQVGLANRKHHKPMELSGGQRQRVAIARALVNSPSIVLADEPTGNLDNTTTEEIMKLMDELNQAGSTIIIVTHEREIADRCHREIHLNDGYIEHDRKNRRKKRGRHVQK